MTPFFNQDGAAGGGAGETGETQPGVDDAPAAGEQQDGSEESKTGVDEKTAAGSDEAKEPQEPKDPEKAFAKRLQAERQKWEAERKAEREKWEAELKAELEKYKDYDVHKKASEYLMRTAGISDPLTLKEEIELAELQERAEKEKVPASVLKRIDELEQKAKKAEEMEAAQKQMQEWQEFEASLKSFCEGKEIDGKPVDHMELWKFMHDNGISKPEAALKAMKADILEAKLETAKNDAIKEYLESKKGPKPGPEGAAASQTPGPAGSWKEAERRALERMRAARQAE